MEFKRGKTNYEATFLPEVMIEESWSHEQTLIELFEKTEFSGKQRYADIKDTIKITTYESMKTTIGYDDYLKTKSEEERK